MDNKIKNISEFVKKEVKKSKYDDTPMYQQNKEVIQMENKKRIGHFEIKDLFDQLRKRYLHKWKIQFANEADELQVMNLWAYHLKDIPSDKIKKAIDIVCERYVEWPPTLGQFKELCLLGTKYKDSGEVLKYTPRKTITDPSKVSVNRVIDLGAVICKKIKTAYPDKNWYAIADIFTQLKKKLRPILPHEDEISFLETLTTFSVDDLREALIN